MQKNNNKSWRRTAQYLLSSPDRRVFAVAGSSVCSASLGYFQGSDCSNYNFYRARIRTVLGQSAR